MDHISPDSPKAPGAPQEQRGTQRGRLLATPRPNNGATWLAVEAAPVFFVGLLIGTLASFPLLELLSRRLGLLVASLLIEACVGGVVIAWVALVHKGALRGLGWPSHSASEIGWGFGAGLVLYAGAVLVVGELLAALYHLISGRAVSAPHQLPTHLPGAALAVAGAAVLLAAVSEELFFRGFMFRSLRRRHSFYVSGAVSALLFGAAHYKSGPWQNSFLLVGVMVFVGLGLAYISERRDNIAAAMGAHAAFNVVGFVVIVLSQR